MMDASLWAGTRRTIEWVGEPPSSSGLYRRAATTRRVRYSPQSRREATQTRKAPDTSQAASARIIYVLVHDIDSPRAIDPIMKAAQHPSRVEGKAGKAGPALKPDKAAPRDEAHPLPEERWNNSNIAQTKVLHVGGAHPEANAPH